MLIAFTASVWMSKTISWIVQTSWIGGLGGCWRNALLAGRLACIFFRIGAVSWHRMSRKNWTCTPTAVWRLHRCNTHKSRNLCSYPWSYLNTVGIAWIGASISVDTHLAYRLCSRSIATTIAIRWRTLRSLWRRSIRLCSRCQTEDGCFGWGRVLSEIWKSHWRHRHHHRMR